MKKVIIEFNTGGDDGVFEQEDLRRCLKSLDLCLCIDSIRTIMMEARDNTNDEHEYELIDNLFDKFFEKLEYYNIDLDELIS